MAGSNSSSSRPFLLSQKFRSMHIFSPLSRTLRSARLNSPLAPLFPLDTKNTGVGVPFFSKLKRIPPATRSAGLGSCHPDQRNAIFAAVVEGSRQSLQSSGQTKEPNLNKWGMGHPQASAIDFAQADLLPRSFDCVPEGGTGTSLRMTCLFCDFYSFETDQDEARAFVCGSDDGPFFPGFEP
jgi:hypothetical protein